MKTCPHCKREISETARKCKFCGNWVNEKEDIIDSKSDKKLNVKNRESNGMNKKGFIRLIIAIAGGCIIPLLIYLIDYILHFYF